jgi:DNA-binding GntR family transcriptional regulator
MTDLAPPRYDRSAPLARQLYELLFQRICNFDLEPFRMLSESSISEELGVSRTPAREALARLAEQGLVDVLPQRGTRVAPLRRSDLEKSQFLREALEVAILRRAMALPDRAPLVRRLRDEVTLQRAYLSVDDIARFYASDEAFHAHIADFAGCGGVMDEIRRVKVHMDRFRHLMVSGVEDLGVVIDQHEGIVDAVAAGDAALVEARMLEHLRRIFAFLPQARARFPQHFEGGAA